MSTVIKRYVSPQEIQVLAVKLAQKVQENLNTFKPTWIVPICRGGATLAKSIDGYLELIGVEANHVPVRTSSYTGIEQQQSTVNVHTLEYIVENCNADDHLLIVDDIFDTGRSVQALLAKLKSKMRLNLPSEIRVAVAFYKPHKNMTEPRIVPDFYVEETSNWLVFPHEFADMTDEEMKAWLEPELYGLIQSKIKKESDCVYTPAPTDE